MPGHCRVCLAYRFWEKKHSKFDSFTPDLVDYSWNTANLLLQCCLILQIKNSVANFFKLINLRKVSLPMKRVKKVERLSEKKKKETQARKAEKE